MRKATDSSNLATEQWARHANASNGFGGSAIDDGGSFPRSYALYHAARAYRSFTLGEIVVAMIQAVVAAR
jgi:hypothetical protein